MKISLITATSSNGIIGKDGKLPWHCPKDLQFFRQNTLGKAVIMGRKTLESMGGPLPQRRNIVLTTDPEWTHPDVTVVHSIEEAIEACHCHYDEEVMVIGGGSVYQQFLDTDSVDRIYHSVIHGRFEGDTFFPLHLLERYRNVLRQSEVCEKSGLFVSFYVYERG